MGNLDLAHYRKFLVAIAGAIVVTAASFWGIGSPIVEAIISLLTALGVYAVPNKPLPLTRRVRGHRDI